MTTQAERVARVEEKVNALEVHLKDIDRKLDDLIALRYKGAGAFWLASALVGTGIVGFFLQLTHWFTGK
jgi:hypothetical protein